MKRKLNLAVIFDQVVSIGGGYCQSLNALEAIDKLPRNISNVQIFVLNKDSYEYIKNKKYCVEYLKLSFFHKVILTLKSNPKFEIIYSFLKVFSSFNILEKILLKKNIDLVYFLSPSRLINDIGSLNFIYTIWDNCHRDNPEFPEIRDNNQFEQREYYLKNILKAFAIITDSNLGKENLIRRYSIDEERIHIIPFEPSIKLNNSNYKYKKLQKYAKLKPYIFYPAQYWPHKNHVYIIEGLKHLETKTNHNINVIFTGNDKGNLSYLKNYAKKLSIDKKVYFMNFLPDEEISYLYKNCLAVVMPTYFGPTNIPPLEAFDNQAPLIYSDLPGMKEQVKGAALLINLEDPLSLVNAISRLIHEKDLRKILIKNGRNILKENNSFNREKVLISIINRFNFKKKCWE